VVEGDAVDGVAERAAGDEAELGGDARRMAQLGVLLQPEERADGDDERDGDEQVVRAGDVAQKAERGAGVLRVAELPVVRDDGDDARIDR
jgi:hypothetical protein